MLKAPPVGIPTKKSTCAPTLVGELGGGGGSSKGGKAGLLELCWHVLKNVVLYMR